MCRWYWSTGCFLYLLTFQNAASRWRTYARRILDWKRSKEQDSKRVHESSPVPAEAAAGALRDRLYSRQTSEVKQVEDVSQNRKY